MTRKYRMSCLGWSVLGALLLSTSLSAVASSAVVTPQAAPQAATIIPQAPQVDAKGYLLLDADSGKILAQKAANTRIAPASLTKLMTLYIVSQSLHSGQMSPDDKVSISKKAWKTEGSRMFVKVGTEVPVRLLIQGVIVDSGNDATVALAEYIGGTEQGFVQIMNQTAQQLGMKDSHFMDATGLPNPQHYTTPHDLAILARALYNHFPENHAWYKQKWFTYNHIKQPNRNRLLWRDPTVTGLKTGHTDQAGYCVASSAEQNGMHLLSVVVGSSSDNARFNASDALLRYGFRFYETQRVAQAGHELTKARVWQGSTSHTPLGINDNFFVTIPAGSSKRLRVQYQPDDPIFAPVATNQALGHMDVTLDGETVATRPLLALSQDKLGGMWKRFSDRLGLLIHRWVA